MGLGGGVRVLSVATSMLLGRRKSRSRSGWSGGALGAGALGAGALGAGALGAGALEVSNPANTIGPEGHNPGFGGALAGIITASAPLNPECFGVPVTRLRWATPRVPATT